MTFSKTKKTHEDLYFLFGGHTQQQSFCVISTKKRPHDLRKICRKKSHKGFSGKFGDIRAKVLRTPKHFPAPTPLNVRVTELKSEQN